jgi:hypothetical protein
MAFLDPSAFLGTNLTNEPITSGLPVPDYFVYVCKAAVVPTLSGSPQWDCLRVSKR